jgi:hypothetical protein
MGLVAGSNDVVAPYWSTTVCALRLTDGRWLLSSARTLPGPTPPTPGAPRKSVLAFARAAASFHRFGDAA